MLIIPHTELSPQALTGVIDAYVLREGTDYGQREYTLEEKRTQVLRMLANGRAEICFDEQEQHIEIRLVET